MPTYEYQCQQCGYRVEYFQSMSEAPRTECPRCHGRLVRLVTSGAGLIFKGSGFYITDYKKQHTPGDNGRHAHHEPKRPDAADEKQTRPVKEPAA